MKCLFLLRHAKSSWDQPGVRDFDRPLNDRGRDAAVRVGRELARVGIGFDLVLASPARRVVETLEKLAVGYGRPLNPRFEPRIYEAGTDDLLALIATAPDDIRSLLLVGHNPGLHELALRLTGDELLRVKYPTGAFAEIRLTGDEWRRVGEGGELGRFIRPRELD
jgi:phosphohistidine phosphatase